ncbi:MAG: hypothetical protein ACK5LT_03735 [Lachnospirales bacterium]
MKKVLKEFKNDINYVSLVEIRGKEVIYKESKDKDFIYEIEFLILYAWDESVVDICCYCREDSYLYLEYIEGQLLYEYPFNDRVKIFIDLVKKLDYKYNDCFEKYSDIAKRAFDKCENNNILKHVTQARELHCHLLDKYPEDVVIHGDLHFYNIICGERNIIIDPKGIISNRIMEFSRYIENEFNNNCDIMYIIEEISRIFNYEVIDLYKALYVDATLSLCWFAEEKDDLEDELKILKFIEDVLRVNKVM